MESERAALVLGATGLVGRELLRKLTQEHEFERIAAFVRRIPEKGEPSWLEHPKLEWFAGDFDRMEAYPSLFHGITDVFSCLGTTIKKAKSQAMFRRVDYEYPLHAAELAVRQGAKRMYTVSALGASADSNIFYSRVKGELEKALAELPWDGLFIFRPSLLLGDREDSRFGERAGSAAMRLLDPIFKLGALAKYRAIPAEAVAEAMISAAREGRGGIQIISNDKMN